MNTEWCVLEIVKQQRLHCWSCIGDVSIIQKHVVRPLHSHSLPQTFLSTFNEAQVQCKPLISLSSCSKQSRLFISWIFVYENYVFIFEVIYTSLVSVQNGIVYLIKTFNGFVCNIQLENLKNWIYGVEFNNCCVKFKLWHVSFLGKHSLNKTYVFKSRFLKNALRCWYF